MGYAYRDADGWREVAPGWHVIDGVNYPAEFIETASEQWRSARGIFPIAEPEAPQADQRIIASRIEGEDRPVRVHDMEAVPAGEARVAAQAAIDAERDRRIIAGFAFGGRVFQSRPEDQKRIAGAFSLALGAVFAGAQPGDLLWHQPVDGKPFAFIAFDNEEVPMDAQTMLAFGRVAAGWESAHIFAARALKNAAEAPADFADDRHWP